MHVIPTNNVDEALQTGLQLLLRKGTQRDSRNGPVMVMRGPVTTIFLEPTHRVLRWPARDANPFFHLHEALWMLSGGHDVRSVSQYVKRMEDFSDDGESLHGAYGYRWRRKFGLDQLEIIISRLRDDPNDRRCVLQMWDARADLGVNTKDAPCNTHIYFSRDERGDLDMSVCCRSNDMIWGAYGANVVHFSVLQEFMASAIGCGLGSYWQISNNYHAYARVFEPLCQEYCQDERDVSIWTDSYSELFHQGDWEPTPLVNTSHENWTVELANYMSWSRPVEDVTSLMPFPALTDPFFRCVALPMRLSYQLYLKSRQLDSPALRSEVLQLARVVLSDNREKSPFPRSDWLQAGEEWLQRRLFALEEN